MVTLYMKGSAETIDGVAVDYIVVSEEEAESLISVGWIADISNLKTS